MAVAFDAQSSAVTRSDAATSLNHSNLTVGAGANRALVGILCLSGTNVAPTMTWNGTSMTLIAQATGTDRLVKIFGLHNPASGNNTLAGSWTTSRNATIAGVCFTGADQTGGTTTFPNGTSGTGTSSTPNLNITSAVGDYVVGGCTYGVVMTTLNDITIFSDIVGSVISCFANRAVGAATVNLDAVISASSTWGYAGLSVKAAAAAVTMPFFHRPTHFRRF